MSPPALVLDVGERRPIFRLPDWVVAELRSALPANWELRTVAAPADGTGDGAGTASSEALRAVRGARIYVGMGVPAPVIEAGRELRWVHTATAGVAASLSPALRARANLVFTNSRAIHGPPVADTVLAMMLHFARGLDLAVRAQASARWDRSSFDAARAPVRELAGSVVGTVGVGGIGGEVAARARALGCRVLALRRRQEPGPHGVEVVWGRAGLERLLDESEYVVLAAPETEATRGLIGRPELARMRGDAVLINVSRGTLLDEGALREALAGGRIRGAALDVFREEPLPEGHPLWRCPNLLITPHVSSYSHRFWEREAELLLDNLRRHLRGMPLRNVVDPVAGY